MCLWKQQRFARSAVPVTTRVAKSSSIKPQQLLHHSQHANSHWQGRVPKLIRLLAHLQVNGWQLCALPLRRSAQRFEQQKGLPFSGRRKRLEKRFQKKCHFCFDTFYIIYCYFSTEKNGCSSDLAAVMRSFGS